MAREVLVSGLVVDQFSALEDNGYSKRSGLGGGNFSVSVFKDGEVDATIVTIEEIATTGEYKVSFTPPVAGFWEVQILLDFNKDIWYGEYVALDVDVAQVVTDIQSNVVSLQLDVDALKLDSSEIKVDLTRVLGLLHHNAIVDKQIYNGQDMLIQGRLRVFDDSANVPTIPNGLETVGLLHEYLIEATHTGVQTTRFSLKKVL